MTNTLEKDKEKRRIHYSVAMIGGFLGGFAILIHGNLLASAQTSNLISLVIAFLGKDALHVLMHLGSMVIYMMGLSLTVLIPRYTHLNLRLCSLAIDAVTLIMVALIPSTVDDFVAMYPIFFAMAFQWNTFSGADGYVSSTIFSTNNLRQFTTAITSYGCDHDKKWLHKASFFGGTLLFYHLGVALAFFACRSYHRYGAFFGYFIIAVSLYLNVADILKEMQIKTAKKIKA